MTRLAAGRGKIVYFLSSGPREGRPSRDEPRTAHRTPGAHRRASDHVTNIPDHPAPVATRGSTVNDRVYTHEFIDIIGANRPNYMHHMTANWSPIAQEERNQLCFGVWGTVGTTGHWPQVVNMWEEAGFDGLAAGLGHELGRPTLQDEKLEKWWKEAANYRRGGFDRVLVPAPWTRTIEELCADSVKGVAYAHETVEVDPGGADDFLSAVRDQAVPTLAPFGWELGHGLGEPRPQLGAERCFLGGVAKVHGISSA